MSNKQVTFGDLTIHEHALQLGNNPACSCGVPLELEWDALSTSTRNLELYEFMRGERRSRSKMAIPVQKRAMLLLESGYTLDDIADATLEVEEVKKQRADSLKGSPMERAGSILEKTGKLPKGLLTNLSKMVVKPKMVVKRNTVLARSA